MKGKLIKILSVVLAIVFIGTSTAFANELSVIGIEADNNSEISIQPRSLYLATAIMEYYIFMLILHQIIL